MQKSVDEVKISEGMLAKLEAIKREYHHNKRVFTPEEDKILLMGWTDPMYNRAELAQKVIGCSYGCALRRYRELTE